MSVSLFLFCWHIHLYHIFDSTYKLHNMVFVSFWLTSLSVIISSWIHVAAANGIISFFSMAENQPVTLKKLKLKGSMRTSRPFRTNTQKRCPFHYRGLECKSRKSRDTWSNRQIWPWSTEWSRAKANRVLPREHTGHSKHPLPTQENTLHMDINRRSTPKSDWLYSLQPKMEKLFTVSKNKTESWLWLRSWTPYCQIRTSIEESRENH